MLGSRGRFRSRDLRDLADEELMELVLTETRRRALLVKLPWSLASLQAAFLELPSKILPFLPDPPLTRDQVKLLKSDNVVSPNALTLRDLGIDDLGWT